jgi:hypothetical protein
LLLQAAWAGAQSAIGGLIVEGKAGMAATPDGYFKLHIDHVGGAV